MTLKDVLEITMLICFGMAWPLSIFKSWTSRTSKGKSIFFLFVIIVGYAAGIGKCVLSLPDTSYLVLVMYLINITMVSLDALLYFHNRRLDRHAGL